MALKVGMLTSGGDCQGLNSTMRGVAKALLEQVPSCQIYGINDGYAGLINGDYRQMKGEDFSGILTLGGTILGTSRQSFKTMNDPVNPEVKDGPTRLQAMLRNYKEMDLDALVVLGGNGTQKTASLLSDNGCNVVSLPKTIDNDLYGTEMTFGFQSAIDKATSVIDSIHTTATSHGRVFIIELMGHKTGWLSLHAGIAGGADIILLPEIPYNPLTVLKALRRREKQKKSFSIIVMAEGAMTVDEARLKNKELGEQRLGRGFRSVAYDLAEHLSDLMVQEVRCVVPSHFVRGGSPCPGDRVLTTQMGVEAADMIIEKDFGKMVAVQKGKITRVSLKEVAFKLKEVPLDSSLLASARKTGIYFGDENL